MKPITTGASLALTLSALLGFGHLADAQEPKSEPAIECLYLYNFPSPKWSEYLESWENQATGDDAPMSNEVVFRNSCKELIIISWLGFQNYGDPTSGRWRLSPGESGWGSNRDAGLADPGEINSKKPFWFGACSVSHSVAFDDKKTNSIVVNVDPDTGTYSCGENGKFGSGRAKTEVKSGPPKTDFDYEEALKKFNKLNKE